MRNKGIIVSVAVEDDSERKLLIAIMLLRADRVREMAASYVTH